MRRAHLFALLVVWPLATAGVFAQGNSHGNANSNSSSNSESNNGQGGSPGGNGSGNSDPGRSTDKPAPQSNADAAQEEALEAVQRGQAVPLSRIVGVLERTNGGEVLDAQMVRAGDVLLYRLKLLLPDGTVTTEFYHAPTGRHID
jgi:hypothetical protein